CERTGIETRFKADSLQETIKPEPSTALYRVVQEALTNVERHSGATRVDIRLKGAHGKVTMTIADNGNGFAVRGLKDPLSGLGLRNMQERMAHFGGVLLVETSADGTQLTARLPKSATERRLEPEVA
ncbi:MULTISPECIES: sensor histidine kinase, partial [Brucella]